MRLATPPGVTLLELIIVLALMALLASVAGVASFRAPDLPRDQVVRQALTDARRDAIISGHNVSVTVLVAGQAYAATALPNGSVVADSGLPVDRLSGTPSRAHSSYGASATHAR